MILSIATAFILLMLSLLHFYWALGGTWGIESTIPERFKDIYHKEANKFMIVLATLVVAFGLLAFSIIILSNYFFTDQFLPQIWVKRLSKLISILFLARALGDFNMFGLFKKQDGSKFCEKDSQIFVPLCLVLGISCLILGFC